METQPVHNSEEVSTAGARLWEEHHDPFYRAQLRRHEVYEGLRSSFRARALVDLTSKAEQLLTLCGMHRLNV